MENEHEDIELSAEALEKTVGGTTKQAGSPTYREWTCNNCGKKIDFNSEWKKKKVDETACPYCGGHDYFCWGT